VFFERLHFRYTSTGKSFSKKSSDNSACASIELSTLYIIYFVDFLA
jgi:hypothetical protein